MDKKENLKMKYICTKCGNLQNKIGVLTDNKALSVLSFLIIVGMLADKNIWIHYIGLIFLLFVLIGCAVNKNYCYTCRCNNCIVPIDSPIGKNIYEKYLISSQKDIKNLK